MTIPDVGGQDPSAAQAQLEAAGFVVTQGTSVYSGYTEGTVAYTSPGGGTALSSGDTVVLYTSTGYVPPPANNGGKGKGKGKGGGKGRG